jgi:hypothetical protein
LRLAAVGSPLAIAGFAARAELAPDKIGVDDAYIFLRYGRNLADGLGWVWNAGGEAVEGFSSLLWTLCAAGVQAFTTRPETPLFVLSVVLVTVGLLIWLRTAATAGALPILAVAAYLVADPSYSVWTAATLMDGGLWCAALLLAASALVALDRSASRRAAAAAAAAQVALALTRPEAMLVAPLAILVAALASRRPARLWLPPALAAAGTQLGLLGWRLATFGWPLPNTYYAKVDESFAVQLAGGLRYLARAAAEDPLRLPIAALAAVAAIAALVRRTAWRDPIGPGREVAVALAAALTLVPAAIAVVEGGDSFPGFRLLAPFRPFEATLLLLAAERLRRRSAPVRADRRARLATAAALIAIASSGYLLGDARWGRLETTTDHERDYRAARKGFSVAHRLERLFGEAPAGPSLGVLAAGAAAYTYSGPSRDLLGLNDPAMAHASRRRRGLHGHSAFTADSLFAAPPDLLPIASETCVGLVAERAGRQFVFRALLRHVDRDPRFGSVYRLVELLDGERGAPVLCTYARREWLARSVHELAWRGVDDRPLAERRRAASAPTP